jgi:uronate dehydrogenase
MRDEQIMKKVLITGMSGLIGGLLRRHLESLGGYELSALNRSPVEGVECTQADIADLEAIQPAFEGKDIVVHLAAYLGGDDWEGQLSGNIIGTHNVYEAARLAGVKRVVFGSSGNTIRGFERVPPYDAIAAGRYAEVPENFPKITHQMIRPADLYGAAKVWGEVLGRYFSDAYGMSILCVRIGSVRAQNRPQSSREYSIYLSHRDVVQILEKCIEAPEHVRYDVFLATSNNRWSYRDLEHPRQVLGYVPQDSADTYR